MIDSRFFVTVFDGTSEMEVIPVSLFECGKGRSPQDGHVPFTVERGYKSIKVMFYCTGCGKYQEFQYRLKQLTKDGGSYAVCPECHFDLGFIGNQKDVEAVASRHRHEVDDFIKEMGFETFFKDPFVIYDVINHLHDLAENNKIMCECGSFDICAHLDFDKVELRCKKCGNTAVISAGSREDLKALKQRSFLEIGSNSDKLRKY